MHPDLLNHELMYNPDFLTNFGEVIENGEVFQGNGDLIGEKAKSVELHHTESSLSSDSVEFPDFSDACINFLGDILLEEGLDETPVTVQEFKALEETQKSLYDALGEGYSPSDDQIGSCFDPSIENQIDGFDGSFGNNHGFGGLGSGYPNFESKLVLNEVPEEAFLSLDDLSNSFLELNPQSSGASNSDESGDRKATSPVSTVTSELTLVKEENKSVSRSRRKKNQRDDGGHEDTRGNKQPASSNEDYVEMKEYDDILLCGEGSMAVCKGESCGVETYVKPQRKGSKGRPVGGKKQNNVAEEVDLMTLLNHCAQAVSSFDLRSANERLKQIRQHCAQHGTSIERLAYYFANALEARIAGTGSTVSANIVDARITSSDFLKAYRTYVEAIPFKRVSFFLANNTILKLAANARKIHIIDFGILLGLQWPCLIQALSKRSSGPAELHITGIEYPQQGFRPAERVEATGRRLAGYCERFNVPFKYKAIAQKWNAIKPQDLKIEKDELVIVNCNYRSGTLLDETVEADNSRDAFLKLIKELNPDLFIHGVINGTFNAPFFVTRFKEALFHYSSLFDVFEATMPRESHARLMMESELYGKELLNVIACEGAERIQRHESYRQWQVRSLRAGLKQVPLDRELLTKAKARARANYLEDFVVDEDKNWVLQGWKGRIFCAQSYWQPR